VPFQGRSVGEERLRFVHLALAGERSVSELCRDFGISRQCGYKWLARYRESGAGEVMSGRSRKPHRSPRRTDQAIEEAVVTLRSRWPDWGAPKLHHVLTGQQPGLKLSRSTVHRILLRHGLVREADRHQPATRSFERAAPNELWQMDFKGPKGFCERTGPLSVLDDHSRYLLALEHLPNARIGAVQMCLRRTFEHHGVPEAMLMDHGTPWWNTSSRWGWTELSVWLMRQGVRVLLSGYRHPQTQGKVERMHGALSRAILRRRADADEQRWLDAFRDEYNHVRPHEALGMQTPASRWHRSGREYQAEPKQWQYAATHQVLLVNDLGRVRWQGRWFAVCQALRGQLVGVQQTADRALLYFCNTPVSELNRATGLATSLPADPFRSLQC
jgi:transposase InsO family protein